jgi:hypothetical protein
VSRAEAEAGTRLETVAEIAHALDLEMMLVPRRLVSSVEAVLAHGTSGAAFDPDSEQRYREGEDEPYPEQV